MSTLLPRHARVLTRLFERFPGVGERTAMRYVLHLLTTEPTFSQALGEAISELHARIGVCSSCGNLAEIPVELSAPIQCDICIDTRRDSSLLCVVARVPDLLAIERSGMMRGRYFVLGHLISPLDGIGPEQLPIEKLRAQVLSNAVRELIIATPPSVDGEATALWLSRELESLNIPITRIASGVPHGSDLEFADQVTLGRAIMGRRGFTS